MLPVGTDASSRLQDSPVPSATRRAALPADVRVDEIPHQDKSPRARPLLQLQQEGLVHSLPRAGGLQQTPTTRCPSLDPSSLFAHELSTRPRLFLRHSSSRSIHSLTQRATLPPPCPVCPFCKARSPPSGHSSRGIHPAVPSARPPPSFRAGSPPERTEEKPPVCSDPSSGFPGALKSLLIGRELLLPACPFPEWKAGRGFGGR